MNTQSQVTIAFRPNVAVINGAVKTTSLKIAEHFGKQHKSVLRAIENLEIPSDYRERNFALSSYEQKIPNGAVKELPCYEITRDGFMILVMDFTGKDAMQWKIAYINAFNQMEATLQASPSDYAELLKLYSETSEYTHELLGRINQYKAHIGGYAPDGPALELSNSITINLAPLKNRKSKRWLITQACSEMVVMMGLDDAQEVITREQFIKELQLDGYIVKRKADMLAFLS